QSLFAFVDRAQRSGVLEASVRIRGARPGNAACGFDVSAAQRAFLRVVGHVRALPRVFLGRAHIDQRLPRRRVLGHLLDKRADVVFASVGGCVVGGTIGRGVGIDRTAFLLPLDAPAIEQ